MAIFTLTGRSTTSCGSTSWFGQRPPTNRTLGGWTWREGSGCPHQIITSLPKPDRIRPWKSETPELQYAFSCFFHLFLLRLYFSGAMLWGSEGGFKQLISCPFQKLSCGDDLSCLLTTHYWHYWLLVGQCSQVDLWFFQITTLLCLADCWLVARAHPTKCYRWALFLWWLLLSNHLDPKANLDRAFKYDHGCGRSVSTSILFVLRGSQQFNR